MFHASMRCASISATAQASANSFMRGASSPRRSGLNFLESSSPTILRLGFRMTAAATTGPNSAPRPASSRPAMRVQPSRRAARSKREEQSRAISCRQPRSLALKRKKGTSGCLSLCKTVDRNLRLGGGCGFGGLFAGGALDAGSLALQIAQVVEARTAHVALANHVNGSDRWGVQRENALNAHAEAHAAHGKA